MNRAPQTRQDVATGPSGRVATPARSPREEEAWEILNLGTGSQPRVASELERETRFELATSCLEGRRSTTELLPLAGTRYDASADDSAGPQALWSVNIVART